MIASGKLVQIGILAVVIGLILTAQPPPATVIGLVVRSTGSVTVVPPGWEDANLQASDVEPVMYPYEGRSVEIQLPKDNQGGAAAAFFTSPYGSGEGTDADHDGIVDARESELAEKFAPIILHDKQDLNLPTEVDWLLQRTSLEYYNNNGFLHKDDHVQQGGPPLTQQALLGKVGTYSGRSVYSDGTRSTGRQHTFALSDVQSADRQGSVSTSNWKTYVHAFRNYFGGVTLQYWRFYAFNTGDQTAHFPIEIDHHGGDWEAVEIILGKDLKPVKYQFLGHTGIDPKNPGEVEIEGTHIRVYSEPGGHASHAACHPDESIAVEKIPGARYRLWLTDLNDVTNVIRQETWSGGTVTWPTEGWRGHPGGKTTTSGGVINLGEKANPMNGQIFLRYSGLWGSLGAKFSGYWGPAYNETQMAQDGLITAWCYSMKASKSNVTNLRAECYPAATSK